MRRLFFLFLILCLSLSTVSAREILVEKGDIVFYYSSPLIGWEQGSWFLSLIQAADLYGKENRWFKRYYEGENLWLVRFILGDSTSTKQWVCNHVQIYDAPTTVSWDENRSHIDVLRPPMGFDIEGCLEAYRKITDRSGIVVWSTHPLWFLFFYDTYTPWDANRERAEKDLNVLYEHIMSQFETDIPQQIEKAIHTPNWSMAETDIGVPDFYIRDASCSSGAFWALVKGMVPYFKDKHWTDLRMLFLDHPERVVWGDMITPGQLCALLLKFGFKRVFSDMPYYQ